MIADIRDAYPDVSINGSGDLMDCLINIVSATQQPVIFIIDEWDAICREFKAGTAAMEVEVLTVQDDQYRSRRR